MTPAGTSNELDVQNEWEENTQHIVLSEEPSSFRLPLTSLCDLPLLFVYFFQVKNGVLYFLDYEDKYVALCMYVCMVITYSRVWINRVRLPILLVVSCTGKMNIPLSPCVPEDLVCRDGFSRPVPRQPAHLHIIYIMVLCVLVSM